MNLTELIKDVSENASTSYPKTVVRNVLSATFDIMGQVLEEGESIKIKNFGTLVIQNKKAAYRRNVTTGDMVLIPAHKAVKFRPSAWLKENLKGE